MEEGSSSHSYLVDLKRGKDNVDGSYNRDGHAHEGRESQGDNGDEVDDVGQCVQCWRVGWTIDDEPQEDECVEGSTNGGQQVTYAEDEVGEGDQLFDTGPEVSHDGNVEGYRYGS